MSAMDLGMTERLKPIHEKVASMVRDEIIPVDEEFLSEIGKNGDRWSYTARQTEILEGLKAKARERGLWNFWLTNSDQGYGLTTVEYAYLAEEMGKAHLGAETFNCSAPDTGNMEVIERYGTEADTAAMFMLLCERAEVPVQWFVNRSDLACGSTVGPILASILGVRTVDVGNAMLSMHSAREMCGASDPAWFVAALGAFYAA